MTGYEVWLRNRHPSHSLGTRKQNNSIIADYFREGTECKGEVIKRATGGGGESGRIKAINIELPA